MTDHEKLKALLDKAGLSKEEFADKLGIKKSSAKSQLAPGKPLPRWAKSVVFVFELINENHDKDGSS